MDGAIEYFRSVAKMERKQTDKVDADGFIICGICGERRQQEIDVPESVHPSGKYRVPVPCRCMREREEEIKKKQEADERERQAQKLLAWSGLKNPRTFAEDNKENHQASAICRKYVIHFDKMSTNNIGLLLYGGVGTGKTFFAECITHALIAHLKRVYFLRASDMLSDVNVVSGVLSKVSACDLLVIDDFGAQRDNKYALEVMHSVFDQRAKVKKPTIITTNLSPDMMAQETDIDKRRIYDRIKEICPVEIKFTGQSQRQIHATNKRDEAIRILKGE